MEEKGTQEMVRRGFMRSTALRAMVIGLAFVLGSAAAAQAADYCLEMGATFTQLTLKAFALPAKGTCKEARGFYGGGPLASFVHGSACRSTTGKEVTFLLSMAGTPPGPAWTGTQVLRLDTSTGTGTGNFCQADTGLGGTCVAAFFMQAPCSPVTVPVP